MRGKPGRQESQKERQASKTNEEKKYDNQASKNDKSEKKEGQ